MSRLAILAAELEGDPLALGYAPSLAAGDDGAVAALLNAPRGTYAHPRGVVPAHAVVAVIDPTEFGALTAAQRTWLTFLVSAGSVDLTSTVIRPALAALFAPGSTTRPRIVALATRDGSRAEQLELGSVTPDDVARARRGS